MIVVDPDEVFVAYTAPVDPGETMYVRVTLGGATVIARSTLIVAESPVGSGIYTATLTAPATAGNYLVVWDYTNEDGTHFGDEGLAVGVVTEDPGDPGDPGTVIPPEVGSPAIPASRPLTIIRADDYDIDESRTFTFNEGTVTWPSLASATFVLAIHGPTAGIITTYDGSNVAGALPRQVVVEMTKIETAALEAGVGRFDLHANLPNGHRVTLARGRTRVLDNP